MSDFGTTLGKLVAREMTQSRGNPERQAEVMEALAKALGMTVALSARGDAKGIDTLLTGLDRYIFDEAATMAKVARTMFARGAV